MIRDIHVNDLFSYREMLPEITHDVRVVLHGYEGGGIEEALNDISLTVSMKLKERNGYG